MIRFDDADMDLLEAAKKPLVELLNKRSGNCLNRTIQALLAAGKVIHNAIAEEKLARARGR